MNRTPIVYSTGYKYQLRQRFYCNTILRPAEDVYLPHFITLRTNGDLFIEAGYAWNGVSGPTYDFKSDMAASLVHDALYQLMGEGLLRKSIWPQADHMLKQLMIEDGAFPPRAKFYELAVNTFGAHFIKPTQSIEIAPGGRVLVYG